MSSIAENPVPKPDTEMMLEHLQLMFGRVATDYPGGRVEIRCLYPDKGKPEAHTFDATTGLKEAVEHSKTFNNAGLNIYFGINPRMPSVAPFGACSEKDVEAAFYSCADLDDQKSYIRYKESDNLEPSFVVMTGTIPARRGHLYFEHDDVCRNLPAWKNIQCGIIDHYASDPAIKDTPRIMRLAGSISFPSQKKTKKDYVPELVKLIKKDTGSYSTEDLVTAFPVPQVVVTSSMPVNLNQSFFNSINPDECIANIKAGIGLHTNGRDLAAHYVGKGLSDEAIKTVLNAALVGVSDGGTISQIDSFILSARTKYDRPNPVNDPVPLTEWGELKELPQALPKAPALPDELIPEPLAPWIQDIADRIQIPLEFIAVPAIVSLSSVIGRSVGIYPKRKDDWLVVPNLWGAIVGRPGVQKSPAINEAIKPLRRLAIEAQEDYKLIAAANEASQQMASFQKRALEDRGKAAAKKGDIEAQKQVEAELIQINLDTAESINTEKRYTVTDPTVEKLGELMNENPRGLLLHRDELYGWLRGLDKSGREGDREFYLEAWNGNGTYSYDRIGRGTKHIDALTLSVLGTIQPGKLSSYVNGALSGGTGDDGLLQRLQLLVWPETTPDWKNIDRWPNTEAKSRAFEIFKKLDDLSFQSTDDDIPALHFDDEAQALFDAWREELEYRIRGDKLKATPAFESHMAKFRSLMPSIALIIHLIDVVDNDAPLGVSLKAARHAACWCDFLEAHARKVYAAEITPDVSASHALADKIKSGAISHGSTLRDIYRNQWSGLSTTEHVRAGISLLAKSNWLRVVEKNSNGRPSEEVEIHPDLRKYSK